MDQEQSYARFWEETLVKGVKELRAERGMTQGQLAQRMSELGFAFHQATVYKIENGERKVSAAEVWGLADVFNVTVDALFSWESVRDSPDVRRRLLWTQADLLTQAILKLDTLARHIRAIQQRFRLNLESEAQRGLTTGKRADPDETVASYYAPLAAFSLHDEVLTKLREEIWTPEFKEVFGATSGIAGLAPIDSHDEVLSEEDYPTDG